MQHWLPMALKTGLLMTSSGRRLQRFVHSSDNSSNNTRMSSQELPNTSLAQAFKKLFSDQHQVFLLDGGTGEELFRHGVPDDRKIWSATAVVHKQYHATLQQVHESFLQAGADAITTNSYGIVPGVGFALDDIAAHCATAGAIARNAVTNCKPSAFVIGSLGPLVESYRPDLIMSHQEGASVYQRIIEALAPHVDAFLAETLSSVEESMQPINALATSSSERVLPPMLISYTLNSEGTLRSGENVVSAIPRILDYAQDRQVKVLAIMFNCCEPEAISAALCQIQSNPAIGEKLRASNCLLGAYANRLEPVASDWSMAESNGPQAMRSDLGPDSYCSRFAAHWFRDFRVQLIGGCCGMTPEHIRTLDTRLRRSERSTEEF